MPKDWQKKVTTTLDVRLCVLRGNRIRSPKRVIRWRARGRDDVRRRWYLVQTCRDIRARCYFDMATSNIRVTPLTPRERSKGYLSWPF